MYNGGSSWAVGPFPNASMRILVQPIALAVLAACAVVITIVSVLLYKRIARLLDTAQEALGTVNRVALGVETLVGEAQKEIATIRVVTQRLTRVSERVEALTVDAADAIQNVLHPVRRISKVMGVVKAALAGVVAGAAVLRRRSGGSDEAGSGEPQEEPTPDRIHVGERSAS